MPCIPFNDVDSCIRSTTACTLHPLFSRQESAYRHVLMSSLFLLASSSGSTAIGGVGVDGGGNTSTTHSTAASSATASATKAAFAGRARAASGGATGVAAAVGGGGSGGGLEVVPASKIWFAHKKFRVVVCLDLSSSAFHLRWGGMPAEFYVDAVMTYIEVCFSCAEIRIAGCLFVCDCSRCCSRC